MILFKSIFDNSPNVNKPLKFNLYSFRQYGEPKLPKPKELKGIKQLFTIDYIPKKCRCPIFIENDNLWIRHNDYFSPSMNLPNDEIGAPLDVLAKKYLDKDKSKKFVYSDAWGDIVLRQEAWIKLENLIHWIDRDVFELDILNEILRQQEKLHNFEEYELCCTDMERFFEKVINSTKKYHKENR